MVNFDLTKTVLVRSTEVGNRGKKDERDSHDTDG
jgi:hypothetical protein